MRMHREKKRQTKREKRQSDSHRKPGRKRDTQSKAWPHSAGQVAAPAARSHACAWRGLGGGIAPAGWSPACLCTSPPSAGSLAGSSTACHNLSSWAESGEERPVLGDPGLPFGCAPTQAQSFTPTHRHGHRLRAHEVLIDLVALSLLVLHAVIQVLILLHRVTAGHRVRQGLGSPQARDPSDPSQIKAVTP